MELLTVGPLTMKIEHNKSQGNYPQFQLEYWNLLGACLGNHGQPEENQHCDTFKGNKEFSYNPADRKKAIHQTIVYSNDGTISSTDDILDDELSDVLNLNVEKLKLARKYVLDGFKDFLTPYNGKVPKERLIRWLDEWNGNSNADNLRPFCQVVVFWIRKKLARY